jgi:hypothetical protein
LNDFKALSNLKIEIFYSKRLKFSGKYLGLDFIKIRGFIAVISPFWRIDAIKIVLIL